MGERDEATHTLTVSSFDPIPSPDRQALTSDHMLAAKTAKETPATATQR